MASSIATLRKDSDSDYGVEFPDLPGYISAGRTLEEAKALAAEALAGHIAVSQDSGSGAVALQPGSGQRRSPSG